MRNTVSSIIQKAGMSFLALSFTALCMAQEGTKQLQYWGSPENYLSAQGTILLENVDKAFDLYPPSTKYSFPRKQALLNFDAVVHNTFYDSTSHLRDFAAVRVRKVLADLDKPMGKGARFYKIYNDGFIIRTKDLTFAVDLNGRAGQILSDELVRQLVSHCSGLFITHNHSDHYDMNVVDEFKAQNKPVYAIDEFRPDDPEIIHCYPPIAGKSKDINVLLGGKSMAVKIFPGHQDNLQCNNYVFYLPNGYTVAHIGDQYNEKDMPMIDGFNKEVKLDVLIMECWINDEPRSIAGYNPRLILSGHENEIGHTIDHREAFWLSYYKMEEVHKVTTPYVIMGWGEWFTYKR